MHIACPSCAHRLQLQRPAPGRYALKCPRCGTPLKLLVPNDPGRVPSLDTVPAQAARTVQDETLAHVPTPPKVAKPSGTSAAETVPDPAVPTLQGNSSAPGSEIETIAAMALAAESGATCRPAIESATHTLDLDATTAHTPASPAEERDASDEMPETLGGYRVLGLLGRGGMGSVYRARQVSLDREVALKVMAPQLAEDPVFVARFCREAYAAAQLIHHNVVQIYDFGEEAGTSYFSMEFVEGQTLADVLKGQGRLEPRVAAGYILQAARGLKQAHDRGLIHRDIKPANLMLDRHGIVKVADLGLVKAVAATPAEEESASSRPASDRGAAPGFGGPLATQVTRVDVAMGTPAFMAPEQARDAAHVDRRADIYALGCTLYTLMTGRPLFEGKSALELITKHASEPIVPPELIIKETPPELSALVQKMVAKDPAARFASLDEVIEALERFLGLSKAGPVMEEPEEVGLLEQGLRALGGAGRRRARIVALLGLGVACAAVVVVALLSGQPHLAGAALGLALLIPPAYCLIGEFARRSPLWRRARQYALESRPGERLAALAVLLLLVAALALAGVLWTSLLLALVAAAVGGIAWVLIEGRGPRDEAVRGVQEMLGGLRRRGWDEEAIRRFVAEKAGPGWYRIRDAVFGPEERLGALLGRGRSGWAQARSGLAAWRDAALLWFEARVRQRQESRLRPHLERVEEESLRARGMSLGEARRQARRAAAAVMAQASQLGRAGLRASQALGDALRSGEGRQRMARSVHEAAERPEQILRSLERGLLARRSEESLEAILGPRARFIAGLVLAAGCLLWAAQNSVRDPNEPRVPLWLPLVPSFLTSAFRGWHAGVGGLILMASALVDGWRIALLAFPAAALALFGPALGLPGWLCVPAALAVAGLGLAAGHPKADESPASQAPGSQ